MKERGLTQFQSPLERSNHDAWANQRKIYERAFICKFAGWHLTTSQWLNFFTDNLRGFWLSEHHPMATSCSYIKCLKSTFEIVIIPPSGRLYGPVHRVRCYILISSSFRKIKTKSFNSNPCIFNYIVVVFLLLTLSE